MRRLMPYMYMLKCADGSYYTGSTWDLHKRVEQHNSGKGSRYTSKRIPVVLVYYEYFELIKSAYEREKQIQGWSRNKKEALIKQNPDKLHEYAKCKNETSSENVPFDSAQGTPFEDY